MILSADILKHRGGDCSNGGLSSKFEEVLVSTEDTDDLESEYSKPLVKIVKRDLFGRTYVHAEPVNPPEKGQSGYMAGGCFIYSCDSRFRQVCEYPVSLHDRTD